MGRFRGFGACAIQPPDGQRLLRLVYRRGDSFVLVFHHPHECSHPLGAAVEQRRPDVFVFAVVMMVQHRHQRPDVIADDVRAAVIARRDTERQSGQQRELAPQHCPAPRPSRGRRKLRRLLVSATELSESLSREKGSRMLDSPLNILPVANGIEWPLTLGVGWF